MQIPCGEFSIGLDNGQGDFSFVSHAHGDHLAGARRRSDLIASEETLALAGLNATAHLPPPVKLYPAGHMLGARQIAVENDGERVVYTGDLSMHSTPITRSAAIIECDRLILDATYADPRYRFPSYEKTVDDLVKWVKANDSANIIIGAYDMGKAQELIDILNRYCNLAPVVNEKTDQICHIYGKFGVKLDRIVVDGAEAEEALSRRFVAIVSMRHAKRYFARRLEDAYGRRTLSAVATGWALNYRFNVDRGFPLSDHADFDALQAYIAQSGAKKVEFHSGDGKSLLQAMGRAPEASPLFTGSL